MKKHRIHKCYVEEKFPWRYLITVYSCSDYYIKRISRIPERRARRVTKEYLSGCFPEWYKSCGLFHVEH